MYNLDTNLSNCDWLKTRSWDLPTQPDLFLDVIGGSSNLEHFLTLPAATMMPKDLRNKLATFSEKSFKVNPDVDLQPRDERGWWVSGGGGLPETTAGVTNEGMLASDRLWNTRHEGLGTDPAALLPTLHRTIEAKFRNMVTIGNDLLKASRSDKELAAQLKEMANSNFATALQDIYNKKEVRFLLETVPDLPSASPESDVDRGAQLAAHFLQDVWSTTASDSHMVSLALQTAAAQKFGLDSSDIQKLATSLYGDSIWGDQMGLSGPMSVVYTARDGVKLMANSPVFKAYVDAVYNRTQDYLKSRGIKELTLYRGMKWDDRASTPKEFWSLGNATARFNPLSSFSTQADAAESFAEVYSSVDKVPRLIEVTVPRQRVFSVPRTGAGCLEEGEVIVLGGPMDISLYHPNAGP